MIKLRSYCFRVQLMVIEKNENKLNDDELDEELPKQNSKNICQVKNEGEN